MLLKLVLSCLILNFLQISNGAKILVYIPTPAFSHQTTFRPLWEELAKRGHKLTVLTTDPMINEIENITQIDLSYSYKIMENHNIYELISSEFQNGVFKFMKTLEVLYEVLEYQLGHPEVQKIVHSQQKYDLVISEFIFSVGFAFGSILQAPTIGVVLFDPHYSAHDVFGNPTHPVLYPDINLKYNGALTFSQRLYSVLYAIIYRVVETQIACTKQNAILQKHFGINNIEAIRNNVSMLFINTNLVFNRARPLTPSTINVGGGLRITKPKPLPKKLQAFLDKAVEGVVYFSLGSIIKSMYISNNTKEILLDAFSELPYKVLWKFEDHSLVSKSPNNVFFFKWLPQADFLHHPNVKLFITQGGVLSLDDAIYSHVPTLGLPFYGDQYNNVNKMVEKGFGLALDPCKLEKEEFKRVVVELIVNPKYRLKAKELGELSLDQPLTGLEKAVWWTEYVIRHKGALHLKMAELPFYESYLLDVTCFVLLVACFTIFTIKAIVKKSIYYLRFPALGDEVKTHLSSMETCRKIKKN